MYFWMYGLFVDVIGLTRLGTTRNRWTSLGYPRVGVLWMFLFHYVDSGEGILG